MKKHLETIELSNLSSVSGGFAWGSVLQNLKKVVPPGPGPTVPLGPYTPPDANRARWA